MRSWSQIYPNTYFLSIFACDRTIYNIKDKRIPRFTPYANDVSSTANRMRATKDQVKQNEAMLKFYRDQLAKVETASKTDSIKCEQQDFETLRAEALKRKRPKQDYMKIQKVDRKWGYCSNVLHENLMLIFSVSPDMSTSEKVEQQLQKSFIQHGKFLHEMTDLFENGYSKETLIFEIPKQLKEIQKKARGAEMITRNSIQPLKLIYAHNIVKKSVAYIFINTKLNGLTYKDA